MNSRHVFLPALVAVSAVILAAPISAQTLTTLHNFTGTYSPSYTNSDGANPSAGLILSSNTLYGTAREGGSAGSGTVFSVNIDGTGFTNLHSFTAVSSSYPYPNGDGADPNSVLILLSNVLYGTTVAGGSFGHGAVFAMNTDGSGFMNLYSFTAVSVSFPYSNSDGATPYAGLISQGNTLFGTTRDGGNFGHGVVFAVNIDGTGFTNLHSFTGGIGGKRPLDRLVLSSNTLYGTALFGGSSDKGIVFAVKTDGTGFTNLHSFTSSDGSTPFAGLILSGYTLYGTTRVGGDLERGTVFRVNTDGTGFTNLHHFTPSPPPNYTNSDGNFPQARLILSDNTLYGTAASGGSWNNGTVFALNTDGTGFTILYSFTDTPEPDLINSDGAGPTSELILSGNTLYGTATYGGSAYNGTVFSLILPPPRLTIIRSAADVILTWPTNAAGFTLQSTTNLVAPVAWSANSPAPVVVNGQNTVTNPISGTQQFYRLNQ